MRARLLAGFLLFAVVVTVLLEVPLGLSLANNARTTAMSELQRDASSLGALVSSVVGRGPIAETQAVISGFAKSENGIVAVLSGGQLEASAGSGSAEELSDPRTKQIVKSAEAGRESGSEGSNDPDDQFLYVAEPVPTEGIAPGSGHKQDVVLLVAVPSAPLNTRIEGDWIKLGLFGAAMLAVAAAAGTLLSRSLTRTLAGIESAVAAVGSGQLRARAPVGRGPAELKALGETVNEMADRLEELVHTQRAFVADASHQLRTPLTALRLRLENLEGVLDAEQRGDLAPALGEADRLSRVVDGLLSLARTEGTRPVRVPVDVMATLEERVDAWSALAEERQVSLVLPAAGGAGLLEAASQAAVAASKPIPKVLACDGHLEQMLDNLLANALDATPAGGKVTLKSVCVGRDVEIHVVDNGPGMSAADRERAFDRFWRPEGAKHEGSGLGLAIVSQLARVSGGSAWLSAAEGGGVDAVVRLEAS
jgi:signal transduction histidine kinase